MNGWTIALLTLTFFGMAWAVDALFSTWGLVAFSVAVLLVPVAAIEIAARMRKQLIPVRAKQNRRRRNGR